MITAKPSSYGNNNYNAILERIHPVSGNPVWIYNIKETYVDEDDPWSGVLAY